MINKKLIVSTIFCIVLLVTGFVLLRFVFAQSCPSNTQVGDTYATLVGEVTDDGGDPNLEVWFQYGLSSSYGSETSHQSKYGTGLFCATITGLTPNTTYYYRAVAKNSAGTDYGEDKSFITLSSQVPTVDIKANNSDGPIIISYGSSVNLTWTSTNVNYCTASGAWSGSKGTYGSESTGSITSSRTYHISCTGPAGSTSDSVTVNVSSPSLSVSLSSSPSSGCVPLNNVDFTANVSGVGAGDITYYFDCTSDGIWDKIETRSYSYFTAYDICHYSSTGNYTARVRAEREGVSAENTTQINVYSCYLTPTVDIKANNSDGPITISYNTSAILNWTSTNANYCTASGAWSGSKSTYGSEFTGNLTSSRTYTLTCWNSGSSDTDSVTINVVGAVSTLTVNKLVRNLSNGTAFAESVLADPGEILSFYIQVRNTGGSLLQNVIIRDTLPNKIRFSGNLKIDGVLVTGDIISGLNIGNLSTNQTKTITFDAEIVGADQFTFGDTQLTNTASASSANVFGSDTARVIVQKKAVLGVTAVPTGLTNNLIVDSFFLPLIISLIIIFLFRSRIIKWEEWLDKRKKEYRDYRAQKLLQLKIAKIKAKEFLKRLGIDRGF